MKKYIDSSIELELHELAVWIADRWSKPFHHSYAITKSSAWTPWRASKYALNPDRWHCETLDEADKHYSWSVGALSFDELAKRLNAEISSNDDEAVSKTCLDIFIWGGVGSIKRSGTSQKWLAERRVDGNLSESLKKAVDILLPDSNSKELSAFNSAGFLMNSSMTKVYAAMNDKVAIYDGRVGAALGLLTRKMLLDKNSREIPQSLQFMWGGDEKRNPSADGYKFPKLPNASSNLNADFIRAKISKNTNFLIEKICNLINENEGKNISSLNVERALFMIGYDVKN